MSLLDFIESNESQSGDIGKSTRRMLGTLVESTVRDITLPVAVDTSDWIVLSSPERLYKKFLFKSTAGLKFFIDELLFFQEKIQHHAKITIENTSVSIETYTHDIDSITEQDKMLSSYCDEIYDDIGFISKGS